MVVEVIPCVVDVLLSEVCVLSTDEVFAVIFEAMIVELKVVILAVEDIFGRCVMIVLFLVTGDFEDNAPDVFVTAGVVGLDVDCVVTRRSCQRYILIESSFLTQSTYHKIST